jgi:hypothetical protein
VQAGDIWQKTNSHKRLILMTHHQPFSAFEKDYVKLQPLVKNKPTAWFWGHEHRFAMYKARPDLERGWLIGHAGVPVWAHSWQPVPAEVEYVSARSFASGLEKSATRVRPGHSHFCAFCQRAQGVWGNQSPEVFS